MIMKQDIQRGYAMYFFIKSLNKSWEVHSVDYTMFCPSFPSELQGKLTSFLSCIDSCYCIVDSNWRVCECVLLMLSVISYKCIECKKHLLSPQFIIMLLRNSFFNKKQHINHFAMSRFIQVHLNEITLFTEIFSTDFWSLASQFRYFFIIIFYFYSARTN